MPPDYEPPTLDDLEVINRGGISGFAAVCFVVGMALVPVAVVLAAWSTQR